MVAERAKREVILTIVDRGVVKNYPGKVEWEGDGVFVNEGKGWGDVQGKTACDCRCKIKIIPCQREEWGGWRVVRGEGVRGRLLLCKEGRKEGKK